MSNKKKLYVKQRLVGMVDMTPEILERANRREIPWPVEYVVQRVIGATAPRIGEQLSKERVDGLCDDAVWEVSIS